MTAVAEWLAVVDAMPPEIFNFCLFVFVWCVWVVTRIDLERVLSDVGYSSYEQDMEVDHNGGDNCGVLVPGIVQPDAEFVYDILDTRRRWDA